MSPAPAAHGVHRTGMKRVAGRRIHLARLIIATGAHGLMSRNTATLLVLNYHRVRAPGLARSEFDDGVFDADLDTFRRQMEWVRDASDVLDEDRLLRLGSGRETPGKKLYTAVTFDDGYIDCFTVVKPILDALNIRGMFFIPLDLLETRQLGWWDIAAYLMKRSSRASIEVQGQRYELGQGLAGSLKKVLGLFKLRPAEQTAGLLDELASACGVSAPNKDRQSAELMNWGQVNKLRTSGHAIGSHTLSHRALATLNLEQQTREIVASRQQLRAVVNGDVLSFAYPVGGPQHFNETSVALVRQAGYEQAFTYNTGIDSVPVSDRFRIPRESAKSLSILKAKALMPRFMGLKAS